jgi:hypothetical protein
MDVKVRFVSKPMVDHQIEPRVEERVFSRDFADRVVRTLRQIGITKASEMVGRMGEIFQSAIVFGLTKALADARTYEEEATRTLMVPVVILDERERAVEIEFAPVEMIEAENIARHAWANYEDTVRGLMKALNGTPFEATQIVDEIFKYLY